MKMCSLFLTIVLAAGLLTGCVGTPVVYDCPDDRYEAAPTAGEGGLKTGLYIDTRLSDSKSAAEEKGAAKFDVTLIAVTVDDGGVIRSCVIDGIAAEAAFDESGRILSDLTTDVLTKNELGEAYGMKQYGGAAYEWKDQAAALAQYAVGKTVAELKNGAIDESGYALDADLASSATIYLGGYVEGIEAAAANAQPLGAQDGDGLRLAVIPTLSGSDADGETEGTVQLDMDVTALTVSGEVITSCYIDSVQAKVSFDARGVISTDLTAPVLTKNALGEAYGMKQYAGSAYEWNEQAAAFADYATGKTAEEVAGIAVTEGKPAEADLAATVTIAIGGFQALIAKALSQ